MTAVEAAPLPLSLGQSSLVKMEERKRPIPYDQHDSAPPLKRQATAPNGASKPHPDTDMPWKDDLEVSPIPPLAYILPRARRSPRSEPSLTSPATSVSKKMPFTAKCRNTRGKRTPLNHN